MMQSARQMSSADDGVYNVYTIQNGKCPYGQLILPKECLDIAQNHSISYTKLKILKKPDTKWPAGCFLKGGEELWGNPATSPESARCTKSNPCICKAEMRKPFIRNNNRRCPRTKFIEAKDECKSAAVYLNLGFTEVHNESFADTKNTPKFCFISDGKLWFNENTNARGKCSTDKPCLCFESRTPVLAPVPPPTIEGAYTEQCTACRSDVVVPKEACGDYVRFLEQRVNNYVPVEMNNPLYPKGCFKIRRTLWYNTADSTASCDQANMKCFCGGGKEAYVQTSDTCPVAKRLTSCDCKKYADKLEKKYSSIQHMDDGLYPAGCFKILGTLWINSNTSSTAKCGPVPGGDAKCICAGPL